MKVGIAGAGRIGAGHAATLASHPDVTELRVYDVNADAAVATAAQLDARPVGTLEEMFDGLDAFAIATATHTHAELIELAVGAGVPTFCEKPVSVDAARTQQVWSVVEASGVPVQIGFQRRFDPGYVSAQRAVADGTIGELRRVHVLSCDPAPPHAEFLPTSGGIYRDMCIHDLDILRFVTGREVVEVFARGVNRGASYFADAGDVDECVALLILDDGTLTTLQSSRYNGHGYDIRMELAGTAATHIVGLSDRSPFASAEPGVTFPGGEPWAGFRDRFGAAYQAELFAFLDMARGRIANPCSIGDALAATYVAEALDLSAKHNRLVQVAEVSASAAAGVE